jgi:hypothetical protein
MLNNQNETISLVQNKFGIANLFSSTFDSDYCYSDCQYCRGDVFNSAYDAF